MCYGLLADYFGAAEYGGYGDGVERLVQRRDLVRSQGNVGRTGVFFQPLEPARAGDRDDPGLFAQHPRERDLGGRRALFGRDTVQQRE